MTTTTPASPNPPSCPSTVHPMHFGNFEVMSEIGRGGYGVVYRALQKDLRRTVAIKFILDPEQATEEDILDFQAEARAHAIVDHPNIAKFFGSGQEQGQHYIYMKRINGPDMATRMAENPPDFRLAAKWMVEVARAVHVIHSNHLIHLDLKPENVVLDKQDNPYIIDFGLAKIFTNGSYMHPGMGIRGTPSYMSPEQADDRKSEIGPLTDVYGIGAIFYAILTHQPPFDDPDPMKTLDKVSENELIPPRKINPAIPPELEAICIRCMKKNPQERFPSAEALAVALENFLNGKPKAQKLSIWTRLKKLWGRSPQQSAPR